MMDETKMRSGVMEFAQSGTTALHYDKFLLGSVAEGMHFNGSRETQAANRYEHLKARALKGDYLPWLQDLIEGMPFCGGYAWVDAGLYADRMLDRLARYPEAAMMISALRDYLSKEPEAHLATIIEAHKSISRVACRLLFEEELDSRLSSRIAAILLRFDIYRVCAQNFDPVPDDVYDRLLSLKTRSLSGMGHLRAMEFKIGLLTLRSGAPARSPAETKDVINFGRIVTKQGLQRLEYYVQEAIDTFKASKSSDLEKGVPFCRVPEGDVLVKRPARRTPRPCVVQDADADEVSSLPESEPVPETAQAAEPDGPDVHPGLVVFTSVGAPETDRGVKILEALRLKRYLGAPIPLSPCPEYSRLRQILDLAPQAGDLLASIIGDMAYRKSAWLQPTMLVGPPGTGKTEFVRALGTILSGSVDVFSCGGVADAHFAGTARSWATGQTSMPVDVIIRRGIANPVIVLDEIDKVGISRQNGNFSDALLAMIEPSSSGTWRDPMIQGPCDLSHVIWLATANSIGDIPSPLRDRFRIVRYPEPRRDDLPAIGLSLMRSIRERHSIQDERLMPNLLPFEIEALRDVWPGGSIRKLRRLIEGVLVARERSMNLN